MPGSGLLAAPHRRYGHTVGGPGGGGSGRLDPP